MNRTCAIVQVAVVVAVACIAALAPAGASGQATSTPNLKGVWVGKIDVMPTPTHWNWSRGKAVRTRWLVVASWSGSNGAAGG